MTTGLLCEFADPAALTAAVRHLRGLGYQRLEAFTPYPLPDLDLPVGRSGARIATSALIAALAGALIAYAVQWWTSADYPLRIGGMPVHAAPAFIPIAFESAVLAGALAALLAGAVVTGLPRWWDELFTISGFERASCDRFFLVIDARDPRFVLERSAEDIATCAPLRVEPVGGGP